jgi:hypothetical protein
MRKLHLRVTADATPDVDRISIGPGILGVADDAERGPALDEKAAAVAADGGAEGEDIELDADLVALRTAPLHRHLPTHPRDRYFGLHYVDDF